MITMVIARHEKDEQVHQEQIKDEMDALITRVELDAAVNLFVNVKEKRRSYYLAEKRKVIDLIEQAKAQGDTTEGAVKKLN